MATGASRQQIENDLIQAVRQRQAEWQGASEATRDAAQQRSLKAFEAFAAFVLDGRIPDEGMPGRSLENSGPTSARSSPRLNAKAFSPRLYRLG